MKILEFHNGCINLESTSYTEIVNKPEKNDLFSCWLETDQRSLFLFSFQQKEDATKFCNSFWIKMLEFMHDEEECFITLRNMIQYSIEKI